LGLVILQRQLVIACLNVDHRSPDKQHVWVRC